MKTWIKATIIAMMALLSSSCTVWWDDEFFEDDSYYLFEDRTWSKIIETRDYAYFVCYEFYKDGSYTYWFLEDDGRVTYSIESGRWEVYKSGHRDEITLTYHGHSDTYDVDEFLEGLSDRNSSSEINAYKRDIDNLYYHH